MNLIMADLVMWQCRLYRNRKREKNKFEPVETSFAILRASAVGHRVEVPIMVGDNLLIKYHLSSIQRLLTS